MLSLNKSIRNLDEGNWRGVCATTAEIVANYAHAPDADALGLTLTKTYVYFLQRPLCKVDAKLSTEKLTPTAYIPSYPQASVNNPRKNPVDNPWLALLAGWPGGGGPAGNGHGHGTPTNIF
jgi:hypothetical protein